MSTIPTLPNATEEIFEELRLGHFLVRNDPNRARRRLYHECEENSELLASYFRPLGYILNQGNGYFFFSKSLQRAQMEKKVGKILDMIDLIALFMEFDSSFDIGWRGAPSSLKESAEDNIVLKDRIDRIKGVRGDTMQTKCKDAFEKMRDNGYMAIENEENETYLVLDSYAYIYTFLNAIKEDQTDESA